MYLVIFKLNKVYPSPFPFKNLSELFSHKVYRRWWITIRLTDTVSDKLLINYVKLLPLHILKKTLDGTISSAFYKGLLREEEVIKPLQFITFASPIALMKRNQ